MARHEHNGANWLRLLTLCFLLTTLLAGCSSKNGSGSLTPEIRGGALTAQERAIVTQNKGRVAREVPDSARPLVEQQTAYYLHEGRKTMAKISMRSENYLAYSKSVFRSYNLPEELAYLALVESGYNTSARSRAGAAGAWQFMPYTGMKYGLQQDRWLDERLDIYRATHAAAQYLQKLHDHFGDWPTAIAAYNAGEGKMARACEAAGERTFFAVAAKNHKLDEKTRLKDETLQYVPRFLAMASIMENLPALGFEPVSPESAPQMAQIRLAPRTDLKAMAGACNMSWNEFQSYNPHFLQNVSHSSRYTCAYVPEERRAQALAYARNPRTGRTVLADATPAPPAPSRKVSRTGAGRATYTLRPGDNLSRVARLHNTSVEAILTANGIRNPNSVHAGQTLVIPGTATVASSSSRGNSSNTYRVQPNDNLWQISRKLNVSVEDLKRWNNLEGHSIHVGQRLVVMR